MKTYLVTFKAKAKSPHEDREFISEGTRKDAIASAKLKLQALEQLSDEQFPAHYFKGKAKEVDGNGFVTTVTDLTSDTQKVEMRYVGTPTPETAASPVKVEDNKPSEVVDQSVVKLSTDEEKQALNEIFEEEYKDFDPITHNINKINTLIAELKPGERLRLEGVQAEVYHATDGYGSTALKEAHKSMAHLRAYLDSDKEITPQLQAIFDFGSAFHCMVLEKDKFFDQFIYMPPEMKKSGKAWQEFKAREGSRTILPYATMQAVDDMGKSVIADPLCNQMLTEGQSEVSYWYKHESGIALKARTDHEHADYAVDLKSTKDENPDKFKRTVKYEYAVQDSLYRLVTGKEFVFIGCEKTPPYSLYVVKQGEDVRERADQALTNVIDKIAQAEQTGIWPGYPIALMETELTNWEINQG